MMALSKLVRTRSGSDPRRQQRVRASGRRSRRRRPVGVMSTTPAGVDRTADGTRWLGSPGSNCPIFSTLRLLPLGKTFEPSYFAIALRTLVDLLRVLLPGVLAVAGVILFCTAVVTFYRSLPLAQVVLYPADRACIVVRVTTLRRLLEENPDGNLCSTMKPLWSAYVWLNESCYLTEMVDSEPECLVWHSVRLGIFAPDGCKIGRWVFLETTLLSEFDLIRIGDRASLNLGCTIQPHLHLKIA